MEYRKLGKTGLDVSILGFGAAPLGDEYGALDESVGARAVHAAIDHGVNFFDTSPYYGRTLSEERLGKALEGRRHSIFLCTKCGRYDIDGFDFSGDRVESSVEESLRRLRTDYLDIFVAHDIEYGDERQIVEETLPALERVKQSGKARFVGITGFPPKFLARVANQWGHEDVILTYAHWNLMVQDIDDSVAAVTGSHGSGLINASPLHLGILSPDGPQPWHPAPDDVKQVGRAVVRKLEELGVEPVVFAMRFALDHPALATTLMGARDVEQVEQNLKALSYQIDPAILYKLKPIIDPVRNKVWEVGRPENQQ